MSYKIRLYIVYYLNELVLKIQKLLKIDDIPEDLCFPDDDSH